MSRISQGRITELIEWLASGNEHGTQVVTACGYFLKRNRGDKIRVIEDRVSTTDESTIEGKQSRLQKALAEAITDADIEDIVAAQAKEAAKGKKSAARFILQTVADNS